MKRARIIVNGKVQKAGFRGFVIDQMRSLKLKGHARNLSTGEVEILCEGKKTNIKKLIKRVKSESPRFTKVDSVKPEWLEYQGDLGKPERKGADVPKTGTQEKMLKVMQSFDQKAEILNERFQEGVGTLKEFKEESAEKQDQMIGNQDKMLGKQDLMIGNQEQMIGNQDKMLGKQGLMVEKQDEMRVDMNQNFSTLRDDYGKISEKIDSMNETLKELTKAILALVKKKS